VIPAEATENAGVALSSIPPFPLHAATLVATRLAILHAFRADGGLEGLQGFFGGFADCTDN